MSEVEYHKGKLKRLDVEDVNVFFEIKYRESVSYLTEEEIQKEYLDHKKYLEKYCPERLNHVWYDLWLESAYDTNKYILVCNKLYEVFDTELDDSDCTILTKINEDEYEYYSSFYNGGTYLGECLVGELTKLESDNRTHDK